MVDLGVVVLVGLLSFLVTIGTCAAILFYNEKNVRARKMREKHSTWQSFIRRYPNCKVLNSNYEVEGLSTVATGIFKSLFTIPNGFLFVGNTRGFVDVTLINDGPVMAEYDPDEAEISKKYDSADILDTFVKWQGANYVWRKCPDTHRNMIILHLSFGEIPDYLVDALENRNVFTCVFNAVYKARDSQKHVKPTLADTLSQEKRGELGDSVFSHWTLTVLDPVSNEWVTHPSSVAAENMLKCQ